MSLLPVGIGAFDSGYTIDQSLRLRNSAPAMFRRTPSSAGNRRTWTISWWAKRSKLGNAGFTVFSAGTSASDTGELVIKYDNNYPDSLAIQTGSTNIRFTNALYRDPSAWHHVVVAFDTTQATAANRHKVYVNGEQVTSFNLSNDLAQNTDTAVNNTVQQAWGYFGRINSQYFDGYLTEMYIIDGQQLTANDFGEFDDDTGVWKPKKYTGTYGTNGAYLNGTGTTYIEDVSGNNNDFTNVNLQLTNSAVSTYDSMADVPTLNDTNTANYCTWNPLRAGANVAVSDGNLKGITSATVAQSVAGTIGMSSGKWYWEVINQGGSLSYTGIVDSTHDMATYIGASSTGSGYAYNTSGQKVGPTSGTAVSYGATYTTNDVIGIALDMDAGTLTFYKNNASQGTAFSSITGTWFAAVSGNGVAGKGGIVNFGQRPFAYTPPTGFLKLNTFNLPDSTIEDGSDYFNTVIFSANGSAASVTGVGFQPDFIWAKNRTSGYSHELWDAIRGVNSDLQSNNTNAEITDVNRLVSFDSDGFSYGTGSNLYVNGTNSVAWNWKANGSGSSNTNGDINSTVSANNTSGFSIVSYTGNGTSNSEQTIGHGLSTAPKVVIVKDRTSASTRWTFYSTDLSSDGTYAVKNLLLNTTGVESAYSSQIRGIQGSNTFSVRDVDANGNANVNKSGDNYIAYCFAEVEGYSAFNTYVGNGSTDGPFVYTGFRPAFVMVKLAANQINAASWQIYDTTRNTFNVIPTYLFADSAGAESNSAATYFSADILSNGFKLRAANTYGINQSGATYIYMAFAENPFKNANAR